MLYSSRSSSQTWPTVSTFENFLFADWGANLTAQALIDQGDRPTVEFFYPYGLLPLLFGRFWFGYSLVTRFSNRVLNVTLNPSAKPPSGRG